MALKDTCATLGALIQAIQSDLEKASEGNKAAAQRVRTTSIKLEKVAKLYRKESVVAAKSGLMEKIKKAKKEVKGKKAAPKVSKVAAGKKKPVAAKKKAVAGKKKPVAAKKNTAKRAVAKKPVAAKRATAKLPKKRSTARRK